MPVRVLRTGLWGVAPLFVCVFLLVGSPGAGATPASATAVAASKTLRVAITQAAPDPFDPPLVFTNASIGLAANVFGGLTRLSTAGKTLPDIAKSWKVSKDGLVYTFTIRQNARFQNGHRITAANIAYSLNRALDPKLASPIAFYLQQVKGYDDVIVSTIRSRHQRAESLHAADRAYKAARKLSRRSEPPGGVGRGQIRHRAVREPVGQPAERRR